MIIKLIGELRSATVILLHFEKVIGIAMIKNLIGIIPGLKLR